MKYKIRNKFYLVLFLICNVVSSCAKQNTRKDIQDKLQGEWHGVIKDVDGNITNEITIKFDGDKFDYKKNYFIDSLGNKKFIKPSNNKFRVFTHSNDIVRDKADIVIERKPNIIESVYRESLYLKASFINKDEIRLLPLLKYNKKVLLGLTDNSKWGFYLKRYKD